jgi:hypothetical protein
MSQGSTIKKTKAARNPSEPMKAKKGSRGGRASRNKDVLPEICLEVRSIFSEVKGPLLRTNHGISEKSEQNFSEVAIHSKNVIFPFKIEIWMGAGRKNKLLRSYRKALRSERQNLLEANIYF